MQLADGNLERPLGLLEHIIIKTCGIEFKHNFAMVDFGQDPSYEVILGQPFMRPLMVLEDWGYNYLYLIHEDVTTTRVNLKDHTFRDVTRMPVEEFESPSFELTPRTTSDSISLKDDWILQTPSQDLLEENQEQTDELIKVEDYIAQPFPEDDIDPYEWIHTLATLDICTLQPQAQFCDEDGYEVLSVQVILVVHQADQATS